ncbi:MAG: septum formation inhibitor Maf [Acidobacteria bacterium]|nr:septum formation inhibitor Maf [Acidobacteriota bacterium]
MLQLPRLILASGSPRRAEILRFVGWEFEKNVADVDETEFLNEKPEDYVRRLAKTKAETVAEHYENALVLGADTIVVIDGQIIGKPKDLTDARRMLLLLSSNWHEVFTGVALVKLSENKPETKVNLQKTRVKFAELSDAEIELLIEKGEPLDKAGAYAVQAQAALFIEKIKGDYWNVVGLPINLVYKMAKDFSAGRAKKNGIAD